MCYNELNFGQKVFSMCIVSGQQWRGKKWYCYGTSMTDNSEFTGVAGTMPDKQDSRPERTGHYSYFLAEFAGLEEFNFGKAGSGVVPALHGEDNIKSRVMTLADGKADADLITVEVIPNDAKAELGEVTDWSDDTFCGNLNQMLAYLLENTRTVVAVLIATRGRYEPLDINVRYHPAGKTAQKRLAWEEAVEKICRMHGVPCWNGAAEANLGYFRVGMNTEYVLDQIHLTEEGGRILARYFWGRLQSIYPIK